LVANKYQTTISRKTLEDEQKNTPNRKHHLNTIKKSVAILCDAVFETLGLSDLFA